ncbi:FxSxx-COOH cyclophane-containing RiPP peptide [Actinoplanes rectilineatus]|uniref:FxSxx-COOH cyclophane-containing RiPP peptide n=1 Tax=Actinoplanes rectilineatus TaxID=113571 RepID=UPI0005F2A775|nr:FxSxx-COOH cyclophane-containing RiPP peptide [Actinoplanes rectilineatus]
MAEGDDRLAPGLVGSDLIDVTGLSLGDVVTRRDSALDHAVKRVLTDLESPDDVISGWNSFIE